jgi:hypothetical protein
MTEVEQRAIPATGEACLGPDEHLFRTGVVRDQVVGEQKPSRISLLEPISPFAESGTYGENLVADIHKKAIFSKC